MNKHLPVVLALLAIMISPALAVVPTVSIPEGIPGVPGGVATAPVNLDYSYDIVSFDLEIHYDTLLLDLSPADVGPGDLTSGWVITPNVDDALGKVILSGYTDSDPLPGGSGSLVELRFHVDPDEDPDVTDVTFGESQGLGTLNNSYIDTCYDDGSIEIVPEPAMLVLLLGGLLLAVPLWRRRR